MTKKKTKKGGFTLVELVIVILVIAILAAILIPTFASLTKKAKMSADEQIVAGINIALTAEEISNGKPSTIEEVNIILTENGYRAPISPSSSDHEFYWIAADNRVVLVKMNGETPESIVYPKELAAKYKLVLPANGEWFKLGDAGCEHTDIEYGALADEDGGSTNHIGVCKICNNVMVEKEAHDTVGEGGACSKCGYKAHTHTYTDYEAVGNGKHLKKCSGCDAAILEDCSFPDGSNTCEHCGYVKPGSSEHTHKFTYTRNNDGTHAIECTVDGCPGFGETTANCTYDAETGKCVFCGYSKPEDKHVHVYKYISNNDGTHTIMCTAAGCTGIGEAVRKCAYDSVTGKCIFCGAEDLQKLKKVNDYFVKNGVRYTGSENFNGHTYNFRNGCLVVDVDDNDIRVDSVDYTKYIAKISHYSGLYGQPSTANDSFFKQAIADGVVTKDVYVDSVALCLNVPNGMNYNYLLSRNSNNENPWGAWDFKDIEVFDYSLPDGTTFKDKSFKDVIKGWGQSDVDAYEQAVKAGDNNIVAIPQIIKSNSFRAYYKAAFGTDSVNVQTYIDAYKNGTLTLTYAEYLKQTYFKKDFTDLTDAEAFKFIGSTGADDSDKGDSYNVQHVEPEVIELIVKAYYYNVYKNAQVDWSGDGGSKDNKGLNGGFAGLVGSNAKLGGNMCWGVYFKNPDFTNYFNGVDVLGPKWTYSLTKWTNAWK